MSGKPRILPLLALLLIAACGTKDEGLVKASVQAPPDDPNNPGAGINLAVADGGANKEECPVGCTPRYYDETRRLACDCPDASIPTDTIVPPAPDAMLVIADAQLVSPDARPLEPDTSPDTLVISPDTAIAPAPDAKLPTPDVYLPPKVTATPDARTPDAYVTTTVVVHDARIPDARLPTPDAYVRSPDTYIAPIIIPDAYVPEPDAYIAPPDAASPDTYVAIPDAYVAPDTSPDTLAPDTQRDTLRPDTLACPTPDTAPVCDQNTDPWWNWETVKLTVKQCSACSHSMDISWQFEGCAPHGFKVAWSKNPNPTYPATNGGHVQYVSDGSVRTLKVSVDDGPGIYYVRMCLYDGGCVEQTGPNGEDWTYSPQKTIDMQF